MNKENNTNFSFDLPKNRSNVIKVIGVGGGGSNAINYMFQQGILGVDFVVCNTDAQALNESSVPIKIQLGANLTEGLGAGANPKVGANAAEESYDDLKNLLNTQTKMVFITAGMGGGTGTGAAPIIAKMARELDILTVGIVTMPFQFEGKLRLDQAQVGLENIKKEVDSLVVINNNKLREVYGNLGFKSGFAKADEVLSKAARGIAEVITHHYTQNIDLRDAKTVLKNSGSAIMGSGTSSGSNRAQEAIIKALDSPLLNDNKITGSKNVLLLIVSGTEEITIDEIGEINDYIQSEAGNNTNIIMGVGEDEKLQDSISVTIIATGFDIDQQNDIVNTEPKKIIHTLEDDQKMEQFLVTKNNEKNSLEFLNENSKNSDLIENNESNYNILLTDEVLDIDVQYDEILSKKNKEDLNNYSESDNSSEQNHKTENFIINNISEDIEQLKIIDEELIESDPKNQTTFDFDISLNKAKNIEDFDIKFDLKKDVNNDDYIEETSNINQQIETLDEHNSSFSNQFEIDSDDRVKEPTDTNIKNIEVVNPEIISSQIDEKNPFEKSIDQADVDENKSRMIHLKEFNYSFKKTINKIDDLEKQPAYERSGLNIENETINKEKASDIIIQTDDNENLNIKSNNSYLHDNAD
ncbi:MAG: cell division protein FtsZ [Flavobacteriaceae bacterium]|nr:cell division protein FtsZ [Flavobacteriaceae bacterium]|tara:strand:- start:1786 stop:3702 length:1917 start_codon:yes stop_codon:yes gene_type:complete